MLFHFTRKPRHRPHPLLAIRPEHNFFEQRKRKSAAGLSWPERTVVVKAYADGDGDSFRAVSGPHEERVPELVGRSRFSHDSDREPAGIECMGRAGGQAHYTAQTLLNKRERVARDMDRRGLGSATGYYLARIAYDLANYIWLCKNARCDRAVRICQF